MEEKPRSVSSNALWFGIITGAVLILYNLILFLAGVYTNKILGYISYLFLIGGMVWGTLEYRKKYLNGFMPYSKAFVSCFMIGLFGGLLVAVYMFVFVKYIHPGYIQEMMDISRQTMYSTNPNMSEEQIEQAVEMSSKFMSPAMIAVSAFIGYAIASVVIALIAAIFVKKEDKSVEPLV
ncbi:MAG TPA: DUF4199 domain-containing protein [Bacteroidales bacterium]|nr:DUF4199 domain-containing protein [Bacteroidales bacterium]HPS73744.1 DUF4199 domain-containing protein [Bacteroidales bacterium]